MTVYAVRLFDSGAPATSGVPLTCHYQRNEPALP